MTIELHEMAQIINCSWISFNRTPNMRKFRCFLCKYTVYLGHLHIAYAES